MSCYCAYFEFSSSLCRAVQLFETAVPLVLTRISIATTFFQTHVRFLWRRISLIPPIFRETHQSNAMTSQLPICNRPSDGQSSARSQTTFAFKDSLSRATHITFGMSSSMHKPRVLSIIAIRYLSVPNIQTHRL